MSQCQSIESLPSDVSLRRFHFNLIYNGAFFFERTRKGETLMTMDSIGAPRVSSFTKKLDKGNSTKGTRKATMTRWTTTRELSKGNLHKITIKREQWQGNLQKGTMTRWTTTDGPLQGKLLQRYYHIISSTTERSKSNHCNVTLIISSSSISTRSYGMEQRAIWPAWYQKRMDDWFILCVGKHGSWSVAMRRR